jgi:hypothetical protein
VKKVNIDNPYKDIEFLKNLADMKGVDIPSSYGLKDILDAIAEKAYIEGNKLFAYSLTIG